MCYKHFFCKDICIKMALAIMLFMQTGRSSMHCLKMMAVFSTSRFVRARRPDNIVAARTKNNAFTSFGNACKAS